MTKWIVTLLSCAALWAAQPSSKADQEVLAAMNAWRQATMTKDVAALQKLLHEDLTYSHSDGRTETKADVLKVVAGKTIVEGIDFSGTTVRVYGTTALVKGVVDFRNNAGGTKTTAHLNVLHVWLKGPGGWQMVARQATRLTP